MRKFILKDATRHAFYVMVNKEEFYFTDQINGATKFDDRDEVEYEQTELAKVGYRTFVLELNRGQYLQ